MFERTKALLGVGSREKRYPDTGSEYEAPADVEDPHTTRDHTSMTATEFITKNSVSIIAFLFLGLVALALLVVYTGRYFVTAFQNVWVQRSLVLGAVLAVGYMQGRSAQRAALEDRDELIVYDPDTREVTRFLGEFRKANEGDHPLFVPIKGFSRWGHSAEPYRISDLSTELVARYDRDPNDEVVIRLHPAVCATASTNTGRKTVQLSSGLDPDPFGHESNVEATLPDLAGESTVTDLKDELSAVRSELQKVEKENNMLRRQRNDAIREAEKTREEIRDEFKDTMEMVYPFASGTSMTMNRQNGNTKKENAQKAREQLNEVMQDD